jgi:hypothetical protein
MNRNSQRDPRRLGAKVRAGQFCSQAFRPLRFEQLEDRQLLSITVDTLTDENDGVGVGEGTSLRDALAAAGPSETIDFAPALTADGPAAIVLRHGELTIDKPLTIQGPGASLLTLDASGNDPTPWPFWPYMPIPDIPHEFGDGSLVLNIHLEASPNSSVQVSGLTMRGGDAGDDIELRGGGIASSFANVVLTECRVTENIGATGGGIYVEHGTLTLERSRVERNFAYAGGVGGGAIHGFDSSVILKQSTLEDNATDGNGGGISFVHGNSLYIDDSTISGNHARDSVSRGGGIYAEVSESSSVQIVNSTISGNSAGWSGGGVFLESSLDSTGDFILQHSTVTQNTAQTTDFGLVGHGGGLSIGEGVLAVLDHSIVADNARGEIGRDDVAGQAAMRFTLIGDGTGAVVTDEGGNLIGNAASPIDSLLGPLSDNGGLTKTHALQKDSPAYNAGDPTAVAGSGATPLNDQRGAPFGRIAIGRTDLGAFESPIVLTPLVVDTLDDLADGDFSAGHLSLRDAIFVANQRDGFDVISFSQALTASGPATIVLQLGELELTEEAWIDGDSLPLTIDAERRSRVLNISAGSGDVRITGLEITGGLTTGDNTEYIVDTTYSGGGIRSVSNGTLTLDRVVLRGNETQGRWADGGGVFSSGGLVITHCQLIGNFAGLPQTVTIVNGGGAAAYGGLIIDQSVIRDNEAFVFGGGVYSRGSTTVFRTIIDANKAQHSGLHSEGWIEVFDSVISNTRESLASYGRGAIVLSAGGRIVRSLILDNDSAGIVYYGGSPLLTIEDSTIARNDRGGVEFEKASGVIRQSTISGNRGDSSWGISGDNSHVTVEGSTISDNGGSLEGGGINIHNVRGESLLHLSGSIVAGNAIDVVGGSLDTLLMEYSLIGNTTGLTAAQLALLNDNGNKANQSASLGPLADNGGPELPGGHRLLTHLPLVTSPAISAGDPNPFAGGLTEYDQRGAPYDRVFGGRVDMGAVEYGAEPGALDFDGSGAVDGGDLTRWELGFGMSEGAESGQGDGDGDGDVDGTDFLRWQRNLGTTVTASSSLASTSAGSATAGEVGNGARTVTVIDDTPIREALFASGDLTALFYGNWWSGRSRKRR